MEKFFTAIEKLRLNLKLALGFSSGLVIAAAIGLHSLSTLGHLEDEMDRMYDMELLGISHIKEANINLIHIGRAMRQAMIAQDEMTRDKARAQIESARTNLRNEMAEARKRIFREETIAKHDEFQRHFARFNENVTHVLSMLEREKAAASEAAKFVTSPEFYNEVNAADDALTAMTRIKELGTKAKLDAVRVEAERTRQVAVLMLALGIVLSLGFGVLIGRSIQRPNGRLRDSVESLAAGKVDAPIPHTDYPNEIGIMARAIQVLQDIYRQANDQHWVKSHISEISAELQQAEDFRNLAQSAVSALAPLVGAGHGAFYLADAEGANFSMLASYGYRERKNLSNSFRIGEGLVGQCAMEKSTIMLTAPKDYIRIGSALGEGPPACIIVLPLMHGGRMLGVLELAAFQAFTDRHRALLDAVVPTLSVGMEILDRNLRTRELLTSTQEQAERMEKQAAQMEEQTVEMEAQQAELMETENWFRSIIDTSPDGMMVVDGNGQIVLANPTAETLFGYDTGTLIGTHLDRLVPPSARVGHDAKRAKFHEEGKTRMMGSNPVVKGLHRDGHEFPIAVSLSPLPARGARGRCVAASVRPLATTNQG